jgi:hypothetical protein
VDCEVIVEAKILGQRRPVIPDWVLALPSTAEPLSLRDIIGAAVRAEAQAFQERQQERRLMRVLTSRQIAVDATAGKVDPGQSDLKQAVDPEEAVRTALQAFTDGLYFVFVDGKQQTALDAAVRLGHDSRVSFVRLVALAGGAPC